MDKETMLAAHLAQANEHIAAAEQRIAEQKARIEKLAADGHDTTWTVRWLATLEETLRVMVAHRDLILNEIQDYAARSRNPPLVS